MEIEEYILNWDDMTECLPYDYGLIWRLYSGKSYKKLNRKQKMLWRTSVKDVAERVGHLMPANWYYSI